MASWALMWRQIWRALLPIDFSEFAHSMEAAILAGRMAFNDINHVEIDCGGGNSASVFNNDGRASYIEGLSFGGKIYIYAEDFENSEIAGGLLPKDPLELLSTEATEALNRYCLASMRGPVNNYHI